MKVRVSQSLVQILRRTLFCVGLVAPCNASGLGDRAWHQVRDVGRGPLGGGSAPSLRCGRTCDDAGRVPEVKDVRLDDASDSVHRQSAQTSFCAAATVKKTAEIPQVLHGLTFL